MDRRRLLAVVGTVGTASCLGGLGRGSSGAGVGHAFQSMAPSDDFAPEDESAPPSVAVEDGTIRVRGVLWVGAPDCKDAGLRALDSTDGTLSATVHDAKTGAHPDNKLFGGSCSDGLQARAYVLTVHDVPDVSSVEATEVNVHDEQRTTSRQV
jgi:hypothetical protein